MTEKQKEENILISEFMGYVITDYSKTDLEYISSWDQQILVYSKVMKLLKECIKNMDSWDYLYNYYHRQKEDYYRAIYNNDIKESFKIIIDLIRHYNLNK